MYFQKWRRKRKPGGGFYKIRSSGTYLRSNCLKTSQNASMFSFLTAREGCAGITYQPRVDVALCCCFQKLGEIWQNTHRRNKTYTRNIVNALTHEKFLAPHDSISWRWRRAGSSITHAVRCGTFCRARCAGKCGLVVSLSLDFMSNRNICFETVINQNHVCRWIGSCSLIDLQYHFWELVNSISSKRSRKLPF